MSEASLQERTERATPRRRQEARDKGEVPKSTEVTTAFLLLTAGGLLWGLGPVLANRFAALLGEGTMRMAVPARSAAAAADLVRDTTMQALLTVAPLLGGLTVAALALAAAQARGVLSTKPLQPDWARLSPQKNLRKMIGIRAIAEPTKSIIKLFIIGLALYVTLRGAWSEIMALGLQPPIVLAHWLGRFAIRLLLTAGATYLLLAGADYAFQLWQHEKNLRMTKDEVRREQKETDGDPHVKARLRTLGRALVRRQMFKDVPKADVVVTNPTHIAVALKYDPFVSLAPIVLAAGERKIAERIKRIAFEAGVPVIEDKPLARALFKAGKVGLPIPTELYVAVAEVLAFVYKRRRGGRGEWKGSTLA
jgi:flagellar biosynthetic protein FlhB